MVSAMTGKTVGQTMNTEEIFATIDRMYTEGEGGKVEEYILGKLSEATKLGDEPVMVQLLNELIGHYRETGEFEKLKLFASKLLNILENGSLKGSMAHATSLLNIANAYRAAGMLRESNVLYREVKSYYDENVAPDSMLYASLLNNMSLLFQEMGDHESAADCLERALGISLLYPECRIEQATTYANLAATLIKLGRLDEAREHLSRSFELFEEDEKPDYHYSAALSAIAEINYLQKDYTSSIKYYEKAMNEIEKCVGKSHAYEITKQNMEAAIAAASAQGSAGEREMPDAQEAAEIRDVSGTREAAQEKDTDGRVSGLELSRLFFEKYGLPMIRERFPEYEDRIAAGLVGEGSECFGFDDEVSRDHDFGPGFCLWLTKKDYKKIGKALQKEYDRLPKEFMGFRRLDMPNAGKRVGVFQIGKFYKALTGIKSVPESDEQWLCIDDERFAAAVNGEVFTDEQGVFSAVREELKKYYPDSVWRRKIAQTAALMSQTGQYNLPRMLGRGDTVTASICLAGFIKNAMRMLYLLNRQYAPYYKWLYKGLGSLDDTMDIPEKLERLAATGAAEDAIPVIEDICTGILGKMSEAGLASNEDNYLEHHVPEFLGGIKKDDVHVEKESDTSDSGLIDRLIELEWKAFDKVQNEGGRAGCQDDHATFSVMRRSQYLLWSKEMLESFIADMEAANEKGWNLITEKYGRMEESTAPEEYAKIKDRLPVISEEKKKIIEAIVAIPVGMMEEFAQQYPKAAGEARKIHTSEDTPADTSYETYLRGEISTYSDEMLGLYGRFVADCARSGRNIAKETITNSALLYGYASLDDMESKL